MGSTINREDKVGCIIPATAIGKGKVRLPEISPVEDDDLVVMQELHMHS